MPETFNINNNYDIDQLIEACNDTTNNNNKKQVVKKHATISNNTLDFDLFSKKITTISLIISVIMIYTMLAIQLITIFN